MRPQRWQCTLSARRAALRCCGRWVKISDISTVTCIGINTARAATDMYILSCLCHENVGSMRLRPPRFLLLAGSGGRADARAAAATVARCSRHVRGSQCPTSCRTGPPSAWTTDQGAALAAVAAGARLHRLRPAMAGARDLLCANNVALDSMTASHSVNTCSRTVEAAFSQ